jgi:hypothetical protein
MGRRVASMDCCVLWPEVYPPCYIPLVTSHIIRPEIKLQFAEGVSTAARRRFCWRYKKGNNMCASPCMYMYLSESGALLPQHLYICMCWRCFGLCILVDYQSKKSVFWLLDWFQSMLRSSYCAVNRLSKCKPIEIISSFFCREIKLLTLKQAKERKKAFIFCEKSY